MKHIVCIIDGTWQTATARRTGESFSNAYNLNWTLNNRARDGNDQVVFYFSGLGSDRTSQPYTAGAFARGLDHQIAEAYINIASNFRPSPTGENPDKIYLFGFSRGAVAARAIAGMISRYGILNPSRMDHYGKIYRAFATGDEIPDGLKKFTSKNVSVEFIGVFDSVFGDYIQSKRFHNLEFPDLNLPERVKTGVQILAIDESRKFFAPMLWDRHLECQNLEQIWIPGVHSDIGGIYQSRHLGMVALRTMIDRIIANTDLAFHPKLLQKLELQINDDNSNPVVNNELTLPWMFFPQFQRRYNPKYPCQFLHPIVQYMEGNEITIRNKIGKRYSLDAFLNGGSIPFFEKWSQDISWIATVTN